MQDLFRVEGLFYRVMSRIWQLLLLNLLMLVTSLPVVTIGAAQAAGFTVTMRMIRGEDTHLVTAYLDSFKQNFKQSTLLWSGLSILSIILMINWRYLTVMNQLSSGVALGVLIVTVLVIYLLQCSFFYIARFQDTLFHALQNVLKVAVSYPIRSLGVLIVTTVPVVIVALSPYLIVFSLYLSFFVGIGFVHFLRTYLLLALFKKVEQEKQ